MKILIRSVLLVFLVIGAGFVAFEQITSVTLEKHPQERFRDVVFQDIEVEFNVPYGSAVTQRGVEQELNFDFYQAKNDGMQARPLIILAHGGYFLFGDKGDFEEECRSLAQAGYAVASIEYRLIDVDNSDWASRRATIDAIHDMKAAVRYFYKDNAGDNKYKVDTDNIFIGGYSAGAITSLHYGYVDSDEEVEQMGGQELMSYVDEHGGLEGESGNAGYSTKVRGVINISGSLFDSDFMTADDPVLFSVHGDDDEIVPYKKGTTGDTNVKTEGSALIHEQAAKIGLNNLLITVGRAGHNAFWECESCEAELKNFVADNLKK